MKKLISVLIACAVALSPCFTAFADGTASPEVSTSQGETSSSGGGGSGGSSGGVSSSVKIEDYEVSGIVRLPDGMTALEGGLDIYGGFGGVSYGGISTFSAIQNETEDEIVSDLESATVIVTVPEGKNFAEYTAECKIASSCDGIYGKFWTVGNISTGGAILSNKETYSSVVNLKADTYRYENVNCALNAATTAAEYAIECDDADADTYVYIIADDGYDRYISRADLKNPTSALNLESTGNYELYCYVPNSDLPENQKLEKGIFDLGSLDFENKNVITLISGLYVSGKINLPEGYVAGDDVNVRVSTSVSETSVTIPKGSANAEYIVGAFEEEYEYLKIEVDDKYLSSGYLTEDGSFLSCTNDLWYALGDERTSVENFDVTLREQYLFCGTVTLSEDIIPEENTYFKVNIEVKGVENGYYYDTDAYVTSDKKTAEYSIGIPKEEANDKFVVSYDYGSYENAEMPEYARSPLSRYKSGGSSGSSGGGSSGIFNGSASYTEKKPDGLMYGFKLFSGDGKLVLREKDALRYEFAERDIKADFTLAKDGEVDTGIISGYFENLVTTGKSVRVTLLDSKGKVVAERMLDNKGGYVFDGLENGDYKIGIAYDGVQYYCRKLRLTEKSEEAETISLDKISTHNDAHYGNIFKTGFRLYFDEVAVNGNDWKKITVCDPYGKVLSIGEDSVWVSLSSFYLKVGNWYASEINGNVITALTDDIDSAYLFEAKYYDAVSAQMYKMANVNATLKLSKSAATITEYEISGDGIDLTVSVKIPTEPGSKIFVAAYDEGNSLIDACEAETEYFTEYGYPLFMKYERDICKIKTFLWEDTKSVSPFGPAEENTVKSV